MDFEEGIQQANEALEIYGRLGNPVGQAQSLIDLAHLLHGNEQLDAAEETASRAINLWSAGLITSLARYINPRAGRGKPFAISG